MMDEFPLLLHEVQELQGRVTVYTKELHICVCNMYMFYKIDFSRGL